MIGAKRRLRGFSAIEMLVVTAIFAIGSLVIATTYINFTRLHRRVANAELLGEELRFVNEYLVRTARNNAVDYPPLPLSLISNTSTITFDRPTGGTIRIAQFATTSAVCAGLGASCLGLSVNNAAFSAITGKFIAVNRFKMYITPVQDPFQPTGIGTYNNNNQPRITFMINASYIASSTLEQAFLSTQTSVASRVYQR